MIRRNIFIIVVALLAIAAAMPAGAVAAIPAGAVAARPIGSAAAAPVRPAAAQLSRVGTSSAGQALLIVLDLSSSMEEDDGTGTIKLSGAKSSLADLMRLQPPGSQIGLWTYPGGTDTCASGGFVPGLRVGPVADPSQLSATIRSLTADGQTPTGPALRSAVDGLRQQGLSSATLLLVSDGESNCGDPPCDVAKDIIREGFDVTVQAVGFRTSTAGRTELQCIANATEGQYYDIEDSGALGSKLREIAVPQLELSVDATASTASASPAMIRAVVRNPSATDTVDVWVTAGFTDPGSRALFPGVVPPRYRVGNVPAGREVERTWTISPGADNQGGIAAYRVTAWGNNAPAATVEGKIQVSGLDLGVSDGGPILTGIEERGGSIAILGDSYSSGEGSADYVQGTDTAPNFCHQSLRTYGAPLYAQDHVRLLACSGAVTADFYAPQRDQGVEKAQIQQLLDGPAPDAVLMTIGGNDIHFSGIIQRCVMHPVQCSSDVDFVKRTYSDIANLGQTLTFAYRSVWLAANDPQLVDARGGRRAPVIVLGYPRVLPDATRGECSGFTSSEIAFGNEVVDRLDEQIADAVEVAAASGAEVYYVPQVRSAIPPGNSACSAVPFINSVDLIVGAKAKFSDFVNSGHHLQELMHPNVLGYRAVTNALVQWSKSVTPISTTSTETPEAPPTISATDPVITIELNGAGTPETQSIRVGEGAEIRLRGFAPGTTVTVTVNSEPRAVASLTVDADGVANGVVYIPLDLPPGAHSLRGYGFDSAGQTRELIQPLAVYPPLPWWWWWAIGLALLAIIGAVVAAILARRGKRAAAISERRDR